MAKNKKDEIEEAAPEAGATLGSILKEHKAEHYNFQERKTWKVSTGSLLLDIAMGGGVEPCLLRIAGANNEGKTPQTLEIIRNFIGANPSKRKAFWVIAEGRGLSKENVERCGLKFVYTDEEWLPGTVFVLESNIFELFIKCVKELVLTNPSGYEYCFVVDSVDGLQLRDDKKKDITENNRVAGTPMLSKKMMQSLSLGMFKYGHLMILISQVTSEIKLDQYAKSANRGGMFSGGNSLLHGADWILEYEPSYAGDYIFDKVGGKMNDDKGSKTIGKWAKVVIGKSAIEASRKQRVSYPIKFGRKPSGIWLEYEIIDTLIAFNKIKDGSAWLSFSDDIIDSAKKANIEIKVQHQGMKKLQTYLEETPAVRDFLYSIVREVVIS